MITVFSGGLWSLVKQSDTTSSIILIVLLLLSILCWSLFLYTLIRAREQRWYLAHLTKKISMHDDPLSYMRECRKNDTLASQFCMRAYELMQQAGPVQMLDDRGWNLLQQQLMQRAEQLIAQQDYVSTILSTSASVAPLLGLLGTVWGLVHAFMNIAATQSADITAVAPGIAEALITTIAGLLVAIPALGMYNWVVSVHNNVREYMYELVDAVIMALYKKR